MEIKIVNDGLKSKDGRPLHTFEYTLNGKEIIDVYHLPLGETIVWESATEENMRVVENGNTVKQKYNGPVVTPWVDMTIEAFVVCEVDKQGRKIIYLASYMIEVQEIGSYPSQRNWIFPVEIENAEQVDFTPYIYQEVIIEAREVLEQSNRPVKWKVKKVTLASEYPEPAALVRNRERDMEDADRFINRLFKETEHTGDNS